MNNNTPWQTVLNPKNVSKIMSAENNLVAIKQSTGLAKKSLGFTAKEISMPRRYSFDDNGGSYLGL